MVSKRTEQEQTNRATIFITKSSLSVQANRIAWVLFELTMQVYSSPLVSVISKDL